MNNRNIGALRAGEMRLILESSLMFMELSDCEEICLCTVRCLKKYFDKETAVAVALRRDGSETLEVKAAAGEGDSAVPFYPDVGGNSPPQAINDPFPGIPSNRSPVLFTWPAKELFPSGLSKVSVDGENPPPFVYAFPLANRERNLGAAIIMARKELSAVETEATAFLIDHAAVFLGRADNERARATTENRHRSIMEGILDAVMIFDENNRLLFANPAARNMFGFDDTGEGNRPPLVQRFSREAVAAIKNDFEAVRRGRGGYLQQYRGFGRDGREVWIEGLGDLISYNDSSAVLVVLRDITCRVEAERKLHEAQEKHRSVLESIEEGYFEIDLAGNPTFCNDVVPRMYNVSRDTYFRMTYRDYMTPDAADAMQREFEELYKTGTPRIHREYEVTAGDGTRMVHELSASLMRDASGEPTGFRGVVRDITEKKRTERALAASEKRYRTILENAGTALIVVEHDIITYANAEFETLSGYPRAEIEGNMTWRDFIHSDHHKRLEEEIARYVQDPAIRIRNISVSLVTKSGGPRDVDVSISWIRGTRSTLASFSDMTEYKKLEKQIIEAQKLEAIGTLAGGIAHNFNNLLMGIQGNASLVLMDLETAHPHYARLKKIEEHVRVGARLTSQLLGFARGGKYEAVPTDLAVLVDRVVRMFESTRKDIHIHRKYENDFYHSEIDQGQIEQVVLNILVNAGQAMPGGGDITITMRNVDHEGDQAAPAGPYVSISIEDSGTGMDTATKEHIFEPFFSTRTLDRGRSGGLGLASAYGIVRNHGGWIIVDTEPARGTVLHVFLPALVDKINLEHEHGDVPRILRGTERVMIIDDEKMVLDVGSEILRTLGYQVVTAAHGSEALDILRRDPLAIDLIVLDMIMPGMNGAAVYEKIREISTTVRVLFASGHSLDGEAVKIVDHNHTGFIQKPFDVQALSKAVRELLGSR